MDKTKKFLYWLVVPNGYRHDATNKQRRWGIWAFWINVALSTVRAVELNSLKAANKNLLKTIDLQEQTIEIQQRTIDNLLDPKVKESLARIGAELRKETNENG